MILHNFIFTIHFIECWQYYQERSTIVSVPIFDIFFTIIILYTSTYFLQKIDSDITCPSPDDYPKMGLLLIIMIRGK